MKDNTKRYLQRNAKNSRKYVKPKKGVNDHLFQIGTNKQASEYDTTAEFLLNFIKRTFEYGNDIAETLRTLKTQKTENWMPTLKTSTATEINIMTRENKQYELEYKAKLDQTMKRIGQYNQNLYKAYAFLWEKCSRAMQNKISGRKDFESEIYNDPIKLLIAIKQHSLNFQDSKYEMSIITDAIRVFVNTKQKENEPLQEYTRRFKSSKDIMESHIGGSIILQKFIRLSQEYKEAKEKYDTNKNSNNNTNMKEPNIYEEKYTTKAASKLYAYIYLDNADKTKYDSILKNLNQQFSLGNNQYPKTITEANAVLNNHKFDTIYIKNRNNNRMNNNKEKQAEIEEPLSLTFTQIEGKCYCCGRSGHKSPNCRLKDTKPRSEWFINTVQLTQSKSDTTNDDNQTVTTKMTEGSNTDSSITTRSSLKRIGWSNIHYNLNNCNMKPKNDLKELVLLDSDSTNTIFCNEKYVNNIRSAKQPLEIQTNGGVMTVTNICDIPYLGTHWFNAEAITNIISLADISKKYRVTMDTAQEKCMTVHLNDDKVKFEQLPGGLYGRKPQVTNNEDNKIKHVENSYLSVDDNVQFISKPQLKKAQRVKTLQNALGMPSFQDMKAMITMNLIKDNEITNEDIDLAETIYGKSIGEIKGKTTRINSQYKRNDTIDIPEELIYKNRDVELSLDTMYVNGLMFLTSISHNIYYRTAQYLPSRKAINYVRNLQEIINIYKHAEFNVKNIYCDQEFKTILQDFATKNNINIFCAPSQAHVPRAERNIRTIKERVRSLFHNLPYRGVPKTILKYLVVHTTETINYLPARYGISKYYSPRMIVLRKLIDFNSHCNHFTGQYVLAHDDKTIKNNLQQRAIDCIYLRPSSITKNMHEFYNIATKQIITRQYCTTIPTTANIINIIEQQAQEDNMPIGITFNPTDEQHLWLAGVDEEDEQRETEQTQSNNNDERENLNNDQQMDINDIHEILESPSEFHIPNHKHKIHDSVNQNKESFTNENETLMNEIFNNPDEEILMNEIFNNPEEEIIFNYDEVDEDELTETDNNNINDDEIDEDELTEENNSIEDNNIIIQKDIETEDQQNYNQNIVQPIENKQNKPNIRTRKPNTKYQDFYQFILSQELENKNKHIELKQYDELDAQVISLFLQNKVPNKEERNITGVCNTNTFNIKKGILKYGKKGREAVNKELAQLHNREVFKPIKLSELSKEEKDKAMSSLIFLTQKRDGTIKARACANGSTQRSYINKEDAASPTVTTEALLTTAVIEAKQNRNVMTLDIPNAFVQTPLPEQEQKVIMRINGILVDYLDELFPGTYSEYIISKNNTKILYVEMKKALYGMMLSSLLFYKHFRKDLEEIGFKINPYDICVANRIINGKQQTVTWHVDDVKVSHKDEKVNKNFYEWCEKKYGSELNGHVKVSEGKIHEYLAMKLDYTEKGKVKIDMKDYIKDMIKEFPEVLSKNIQCPWNTRLFDIAKDSKLLSMMKQNIFHTFVMKSMFLGKRARPDILVGISYLSTRVLNSNEADWKKLVRILSYLNNTRDMVLSLEADDDQQLIWYVDASFGVHSDLKSHTGSIFTIGKGAIWNASTKQKVNARSSTEAELISIDDQVSKIVWMKKFIESQGFDVKLNILYQDNQSTIKLAENGKYSSGKRTRHFDIKYFYITDLISQKEISIKYCSSNNMLADYHTKPLIGEKFKEMRNKILNICID